MEIEDSYCTVPKNVAKKSSWVVRIFVRSFPYGVFGHRIEKFLAIFEHNLFLRVLRFKNIVGKLGVYPTSELQPGRFYRFLKVQDILEIILPWAGVISIDFRG